VLVSPMMSACASPAKSAATNTFDLPLRIEVRFAGKLRGANCIAVGMFNLRVRESEYCRADFAGDAHADIIGLTNTGV